MNTKNLLPLIAITADHFTWTDSVGVSEASDLPEHLLSRVYRDSCDRGFLCLSMRTGNVMLFVEKGVIRDSQDEFVGWRMTDAEGLGLTIDILND